MKKNLETERLDGLRTAKTDTRHSRHPVLLVRKSSLHSSSGPAEASLNPQRRGKVLVEGGGRERETVEYKTSEHLNCCAVFSRRIDSRARTS
jgi:hypothetical protein